MTVKQLSVFLENKAGRLADVTGVLGDADVNILALSLADTTDFGILRLIVDDSAKAAEALSARGVVCITNDVTAVAVEDKPGGWRAFCRCWSSSRSTSSTCTRSRTAIRSVRR